MKGSRSEALNPLALTPALSRKRERGKCAEESGEPHSHFARFRSQNSTPQTPTVALIIAGYAHGLSSSGM